MSVFQQNQDRLNTKRKNLEAHERMCQHYERYLPYLAYLDEQDERVFAGGRSARSSLNAQKRGIERLFKLESDAHQAGYWTPDEIQLMVDLTGKTPAEIRNQMWTDMISEHFGQLEPTHAVSVDPENRRDVRDNYLYNEWLEQLRQPNPVRTYPVYALVTAIKAVVRLYADKHSAEELIATFHDFTTFPQTIYRDEILQHTQNPMFMSTPAQYLAMTERFPGLLHIAESFLLQYSDFVRLERSLDNRDDAVVGSPLPDDPGSSSFQSRYEMPEYMRIEAAVQAYEAQEGSVRVLAERYNLGRDKLFKVLKARGILRPTGGDRRKG